MPEVLSSWKEIALYLGKGVRTVQRWEADRGLPIHRLHGGDKRAVLAFREELDSWIRGIDTSSGQSELVMLRREVETLRAENAALKLQVNRHPTTKSSNFDIYVARNILDRSAALIKQTADLQESAAQIRTEARRVRAAFGVSCHNGNGTVRPLTK